MFGLKNEIVERIKDVFANYPPVEQVILYGSRAVGSYKNGSDIDLTLKGDNLNLTIANKLCNDLDDLLLPYTFDISIFSHISNPDLIEHIERVGIEFYNSRLLRLLRL